MLRPIQAKEALLFYRKLIFDEHFIAITDGKLLACDLNATFGDFIDVLTIDDIRFVDTQKMMLTETLLNFGNRVTDDS